MLRPLRAVLTAVSALLLVGTAVPAVAAPAGSGRAFDPRPAAAALHRLIGGRAGQVTLRALDKGTGKDRFAVTAEHGRLVVAGTSPAVLLAGFGWYLKYTAHANISLEGENLRLPARLPLPSAPIEHTSSVTHRFALNDTNEGYGGPYLSWDEWQHRIDVLALRGINEVLLYEGQEAVYQKTFEQFGYGANEMRGWIPQPGHQSWWLLQNICCTAGPISQQLIDRHARLGRQIADRLRQLGMTPVMPGYYGTVPPGFADRNGGAHTVPQGTWDGLARPDWLDPTDPSFAKVAAAFYRAQDQLFGATTMYKMDLLHEGGTAGNVSVPDASKAVQAALAAAHPDALWAILGWEKNPLPATLSAVDRSKMVVLDGISDQPSVTDRDSDFQGTPYAFGTIWNFGGHTNLGAQLAEWNQKFFAWQRKSGSALDGIALMPEAIDNNPAAVEFFTELPWLSGPVDLHQWFDQYATARYGTADPHALAAWRVLADTVYSWPANVDSRHPTSLFENQPSLSTSSSALPYDPAAFDPVLADLLAVSPALRHSTAYRYDLVDVARQVLANHSRSLLPDIKAAYDAKDAAEFGRLSGQWLAQISLLDRLLGSDDHFLLGAWQKDADRQVATPAEAATLRYDLRVLVTQWAPGTTLQDYARREFNGLVGDYYASRWRAYFRTLSDSLATGKPPEAVDWQAFADTWAHAGTDYPATAHGDPYALASAVAAVPNGAVTVGSKHDAADPGGSVRVAATFTNRNLIRATEPVALSLHAPDGYQVSADGATETRTVPAAGTFTATWTVSVPDTATPGTVPTLSAAATWASGGVADQAAATTSMLVTGGLTGYETVTTTGAAYAGNGDTVGIAGGGSDPNGGDFGAAYRQGVLGDGQAATATVTRVDSTSPYGRAGLVARADLGATSSGYATIAVTPGHGCMFTYDADGDGTLDRSAEVDGFAGETMVRLGRKGSTFTGECSTDGTNWTVVGSAELPGASDAEDVGMYFAGAGADTSGLATFTGFGLGGFAPRDASGDTVRSLKQPVTALGAEAGHPATAANDGNRANSPYWGGPLTGDGTWWQVDLGAETAVSGINVRNYVDGTRWYTYRVVGSLDGEHWYTLGGRMGTSPVTDAGETFHTEATARYVRVIGLSNSANATFHLSEVTVYGTPTGGGTAG
ncbi:MAG TPA: alpha-N-acetylglucosaminidase TIM-barrel domain-containing protein [Actinocatenispora sp.]